MSVRTILWVILVFVLFIQAIVLVPAALLFGRYVPIDALYPTLWQAIWASPLSYFLVKEYRYALRHPLESVYNRRLVKACRQQHKYQMLQAGDYYLWYAETGPPIIARIERSMLIEAIRGQGATEIPAEYFLLFGRYDSIRRELGVVTIKVRSDGSWSAHDGGRHKQKSTGYRLHRRLVRQGMFDVSIEKLEELLQQITSATPARA